MHGLVSVILHYHGHRLGTRTINTVVTGGAECRSRNGSIRGLHMGRRGKKTVDILVPQGVVGLQALLGAVVVVELAEGEEVHGELDGVVVVEELDAAVDGKDNIGVVLDRQRVDGARALADPISATGNPVVPMGRMH